MLGEAWGPRAWSAAGHLPGMADALERLRVHADASAEMAAGAGCTSRTVELIRHQADPVEPAAGELLRLADEAN